MKALLHPQEIETHYIIPTLRRLFALALKKKGKSQVEIAKILNVTPATVSQYAHDKRGISITFSKEIEKIVNEVDITDQTSYIRATQKLLLEIRKSGDLCTIHKNFGQLPTTCDPELMGCM